ncbi:MAG: hypothetical protein ACM3OB_09175 [Acidobacteriota bacterium]
MTRAASGPPPARARLAARVGRFELLTFLLAGLVSAWMVAHAQVGGDQLDLLARGWRLAARGSLVPYGNPLSNGGKEIGALTSLLVGLPLTLWMDHRAPVVVVWASHLLAFLLLLRTLRPILHPAERLAFALLYGLGPWRLYFAGFLWNPNYLYLIGAVHLATALAQRARPRLGASFAHALALGLALQLHPSFLILAVASLLLVWRGYARPHWPGILAGGLVAALPLVPWIAYLRHDPGILPGGKGFLGHGLVTLYPIFGGLWHWLRYSTLLVARRMGTIDLSARFGERFDAALVPLWSALVDGLGALAALVALIGLWRFLRHHGISLLRRRLPSGASDRQWLRGYVTWTLAAAVLAFAAAPTAVMWWQELAVVHAAILPTVFLLGTLLVSPRWRRWARPGLALYAGATVLLLGGMALGAAHYRCDGRQTVNLALRSDHPMFHDLGILQSCPFPIDPAHGWWPDALPPE